MAQMLVSHEFGESLAHDALSYGPHLWRRSVRLRIAIVGGGLGGLAAALFLRKAGLHATVYEQASELREVGAGLVVPPNMVRPLAKLGLADKLPSFAVRLEAAWEFRRWRMAGCCSSSPWVSSASASTARIATSPTA